jgi:K+-transporting ATPase ATPase A chain
LIRGFTRESSPTIGNFWADLFRGSVYFFLPLSFVMALFLIWQGTPQNLGDYVNIGQAGQQVLLDQGPVAGHVAIKQLGTNGGGYFGTNSAHPLENPTYLTNCIQEFAILFLPIAVVFAFGEMLRDRRQAWALLLTMTLLFVIGLSVAVWQEAKAPGWVAPYIAENFPGHVLENQQLGNMEGKELRFGPFHSAFWSVATTVTSSGSANAALDSNYPLSVLTMMVNMKLGEVVFGGVGSGIYGILLLCFLTVFLAGLMIGRTPEYLGKKIEVFEVKLTMLALLIAPILILVGTAIAVVLPGARESVLNPGPYGFSEILYGYTSAAANNGSALGGLDMTLPFYALSQALIMFLGRYLVIIPVLGIAASMAMKKKIPSSMATLPTHGILFILFLAFVIVALGALTYFPVLTLGPIAEHVQMVK